MATVVVTGHRKHRGREKNSGEDVPTQDDDVPTQDDDVPTQDDDVPTQDDDVPTQDDDVPTQDQDDDVPTQDDDGGNNSLPRSSFIQQKNTKKDAYVFFCDTINMVIPEQCFIYICIFLEKFCNVVAILYEICTL